MKRNVKPVPDGYRTVTSYLVVSGVGKLIEFLKNAFDAQVIEKFAAPGGGVMHAEVKIGDSIVMMGEAQPDRFPARPSTLYLYVADVDVVYRRAVEAGGKSLGEPKDQLYGDRSGAVEDPSGNSWYIATHIEDVGPDEVERRMAALQKQQ